MNLKLKLENELFVEMTEFVTKLLYEFSLVLIIKLFIV